jgi:hypothetical protein
VHAATRCSLTARRPFYACRAFLDDQLLNVSTHQSTRRWSDSGHSNWSWAASWASREVAASASRVPQVTLVKREKLRPDEPARAL